MKVKCTGYKGTERCFTIGKVYEWEDETLKNDNGFVYTSFMVGGDNPDEWGLSKLYKFEVVNEPKFKVGDIVKANGKSNYKYGITNKENGFVGKVTKIEECGLGMIFVQGFEKRHKTYDDKGWHVQEDYFDLVQEPKSKQEIHITVDGAKTIAVMKSGGKVIKRTEAKCNPLDEFDFKTGAELAFKRLFVEEQKDTDFKVGDKVRYIGHDTDGRFYPPYGTIGKIQFISIYSIGVKWNTDKVKHYKPDVLDFWKCDKTDVEKVTK